jgi:hypothetical protein
MVFGVALSVIACAAEATPPPSGKGDPVSTSNSTKPTTPTSPSASAPASPTAPGTPTSATPGSASSDASNDASCAAQKGDACSTCCEKAHSKGAETYLTALDNCLCVAARCATECAKTECSDDDNAPDPTPGDACDVCMKKFTNDDGTGACDTEIKPKCDGDADCKVYLACDDQCE